MPRPSSTSPWAPGRNQNWLRYQPPGNAASAGEAANAERTSASTAQPSRSQRGGTTRRVPPVSSGTTPPSNSIWPNRATSRVVAHRPPSCTAVPSPSCSRRASYSAPIGAHTSAEISSAMGRPAARSHTQPSTSDSAERYRKRLPCGPSACRVVRKRYSPRGSPAGGPSVPGCQSIHSSSRLMSACGLVYSSRKATPLRMSKTCRTVAPA
jgi:hypothetical protein